MSVRADTPPASDEPRPITTGRIDLATVDQADREELAKAGVV